MNKREREQVGDEAVEIEKWDLLPLVKEMIPDLHERMKPYNLRDYEIVGSLIATWHASQNKIKRLRKENRRLRDALQMDFKVSSGDRRWGDKYV
jgi:hypothetical protein